MSFHKPDLYRWKRREEPRVYSRSQRVATNDDIHDWIKTVEDASNKAAAEAFGVPYQASRTQGKAKAQATIQHVREHDAAYAEAQDLLNQWVTDKINLDDDTGYDDFDDGWHSKPSKAQIKREWDNLVDLDDYNDEIPDVPRTRSHKTPSADPYYDLENEDEGEVVSNILSNLMEKEVVHDGFKGDLGLEKRPEVDPRTKMKMRHQQVKENREKREQELEKKRKEQQSRKEATFKAKQIIMKEEKEKAMKVKKEEQLLQQEMTQIRKEMLDQRRLEEEKKARERKEQEELAQKAREELERQRWEEEQQELESRHKAEMERRHRLVVIEKFQAEISSRNLKILQRYFSAWYDVVLERRLQMGKARAMSDWRCLLKAWNSWKMFVRGRRLDREAREHEEDMKLHHRKRQMADNHYRFTLRRRCFVAWQLFLTLNAAEKDLHRDKSKTKNKMAAFLEKAATGELWSDRSSKPEISKHNGKERGMDSARQKVDEIFAASENRPKHRRKGSDSARSDLTTSRSETSTITNNSSHHRGGVKTPTEPWQVTRKHLKLTNEQIASIGPGHGDEGEGQSNPQRERKIRQEMRAWEKPAPPTSTFEHRHKEQQSMLKVQQKQIKEQQKLIEDLQYMQKQQLLQMQLNQQQNVSEQLNNGVDLHSLQAAQEQLEKLQQSVAAKSKEMKVNNKMKEKAGKPQISGGGDGPDTARTETTSVSSVASSGSKRHEEFQQKMEERAAERRRIKEEREAKKRQQEQEKLAKIKAEEAERLRREEEEKKARIEARREQKRLEREREHERQRQIDRMQELNTMAEAHYQKTLLRRRGLQPWKKLVTMAQDNERCAVEHYSHNILRKCLLAWHDTVREEVEEKEALADNLYNFIIVRRSFKNWRRHGKYFAIQEEKARRFHEKRIKWKILRAWSDYAIEAKMRMWELERLSREHNIHRMKKTYFKAWRRYPRVLREERDRERRKADMRKKVASLLPDFSASSETKCSWD